MTDGATPTGVEHMITALDESEEEGKKLTQRERLLETVLAAGITFFHDADGCAFAAVPGDGGSLSYYRVGSRRFELAARVIYGNANRSVVGAKGVVIPGSVGATAWAEAVTSFEAMALEGPAREVEVRAIKREEVVWIDLGRVDWRGVRVTAEGWQVVTRIDAPLIRPEGLREMPIPQPSADALGDLARLVNVSGGRDGRDMKLIAAWATAALYPVGPYAVLAVNGEQGSAKSTFCRMLRRLVDPNKADLRAPPRNRDDLITAAQNSRVVALDNVSSIPADVADDLCRLATGAGLSKRRLFTDGEEYLVAVARPVLLNGIPSLLERGDLADRALAVTLPPIPDDKRRPEAEVRQDFEGAAPSILALLLEALALGLRDMGTVQLPRLPRMADFARLVCAAAPAFGWQPGAMLDALEGNRADAIEAVIEADPVAVAVRGMMEPSKERPDPRTWTGTASELLEMVNRCAPFDAQRERTWPKDGARLSTRLRRIAPALRRGGIEVVLPTAGGRAGRIIAIKARQGAVQRSERSQRSDPSGSAICGYAPLADERSGSADSVPPNTDTVPEHSTVLEQDQHVGRNGNARNAGNAPAHTVAGGYL